MKKRKIYSTGNPIDDVETKEYESLIQAYQYLQNKDDSQILKAFSDPNRIRTMIHFMENAYKEIVVYRHYIKLLEHGFDEIFSIMMEMKELKDEYNQTLYNSENQDGDSNDKKGN